jgi:hypothetical protein
VRIKDDAGLRNDEDGDDDAPGTTELVDWRAGNEKREQSIMLLG